MGVITSLPDEKTPPQWVQYLTRVRSLRVQRLPSTLFGYVGTGWRRKIGPDLYVTSGLEFTATLPNVPRDYGKHMTDED